MPDNSPMNEEDWANFEPPVSQGQYFKFENGKQNMLRLIGKPAIYTSSFKGQNPRDMYAWVIWNMDSKTAQVLQIPVTVFNMIRGYAKDAEYGDPTQYALKITRTGEKFDTKYEVIASPNKMPIEQVPDYDAEAVAKIDLQELIEKGTGNSYFEWLSSNTKREPMPPSTEEAPGPGPEDHNGPQGW